MGFANRTLRVSIPYIPFLISIQNSNGISTIGGGVGKLISSLFVFARRIFNVTFCANEEIGNQIENKSWSGILGMFERDETDITIPALPYFENMPPDLSPLQHSTRTNILSTAKIRTEFSTLTNFPLVLWLFIVIALLIVSFFFTLGTSKSLLENIFALSRYLYYQGNIKNHSFYHKTLTISFCFSTMIICITFSCLISTDLVTVDDSETINTFEKLSSSNLLPIVFIGDRFFYKEIESNNSRFPQIQKRVKKESSAISYTDIDKLSNYFYGTGADNIAIIMSNFINLWIANNFCSEKWWFSKETINEEALFMWMNVKLDDFAQEYLYDLSYSLFESGINTKLSIEAMHTVISGKAGKCNLESLSQLYQSRKNSLSINNIDRMVIIIVCCFIISFNVLILEILYKKYCLLS